MIRARIAPSPTGFAHVGTAYTGLFNYAFAKHNNGKFIIRIEDTDRKRHVEGAEEAIHEGLRWIGLSWDESTDVGGPHAPYRQSERLDLYKKKVRELIDSGKAYEDDGAIRFKNPGRDVSWNDLVRGEITFPSDQVTDFIIVKSDGYPTYHFAVVVDDIEMKITHVIRGEEHIANTPRQIVLYEALGAIPPEFGHHPTLRNADRKKLSKRNDPVNISLYKEQGYLPKALVNFLSLQGWSHPDGKEIFDLEEFVKLFDIKKVLKSGPIFDIKKLDWINGHYIRELSSEEFAKYAQEFLKTDNKELIDKITPLLKERIAKFGDLPGLAGFFLEEPKIDTSLFGENYKSHLQTALEVIEKVDTWNLENLNEKLMEQIKQKGYKTGDFFMDLRVVITGKKFTPPINDSVILLGKIESLKRIKKIL